MENPQINAVTHSEGEVKVSVVGVRDEPGIAARIIGPLAESNIVLDMIVQNISSNGRTTDMTFTVPAGDMAQTKSCFHTLRNIYESIHFDDSVAKVSVVGVGVRSHTKVALTLFRTLADHGINIHLITTSDIKISVLIDKGMAAKAVQALHTAYGVDIRG